MDSADSTLAGLGGVTDGHWSSCTPGAVAKVDIVVLTEGKGGRANLGLTCGVVAHLSDNGAIKAALLEACSILPAAGEQVAETRRGTGIADLGGARRQIGATGLTFVTRVEDAVSRTARVAKPKLVASTKGYAGLTNGSYAGPGQTSLPLSSAIDAVVGVAKTVGVASSGLCPAANGLIGLTSRRPTRAQHGVALGSDFAGH
jgi:hypothetical protein